MGRVDPEVVTSTSVPGGSASSIYVKFTGYMGAGEQDPVSYEGDVSALGPNPPAACPCPPCGTQCQETIFSLATVAVTSLKTVTVVVTGPSKTKKSTFNVYPPP